MLTQDFTSCGLPAWTIIQTASSEQLDFVFLVSPYFSVFDTMW